MTENFHDIKLTPNINNVKVVGKVIKGVTSSHIFSGQLFYFFLLEVKYANNKRSDVIHIFIPEDKILSENKIIDIGDMMEVTGPLVHSKMGEKFDVSILAEEVTLMPADADYENILYVGGRIHKMYDITNIEGTNKIVKSFIIKHESEDGRFFTLRVVTWNNLAKLVDKQYKEGDIIVVKGRFESRESNNGEQKIYLHEALANIIIDATKLGE